MSQFPEPALDELYRELILDHYKNPRHREKLADADVTAEGFNPVCGDEIRLQLRIEDDAIREARFLGQGCSISQAAVSMMTTLLEGRKLSDAEALAGRFTSMMHGDQDAATDRSLGDLRAFQGVAKFPVRIKCALLGFDALLEALKRTAGGEEGAH